LPKRFSKGRGGSWRGSLKNVKEDAPADPDDLDDFETQQPSAKAPRYTAEKQPPSRVIRIQIEIQLQKLLFEPHF
jgi:hypothetical protein